ncbi:MAG TPA: phospholipase D-like domain-containing protein [Thermoanaerobaculia bacterium]
MAVAEERTAREAPGAPPPKVHKRARTFVISYAAAGLYVAVLLILTLLLWSARRERESHVRVPDLAGFEQALPSIANLTGSPIVAGNQVEVLQNGEGFFPPLFRDIEAAKESIHLETYVWWKGDVCRRLADALAAKAAEGVEVRLLLDAVGSKKGEDELFEKIEKAGGKVERFHPFHIQDVGLINNRTHRKLAILDGRIAYVFGHGIAEEWTGHGQDEKHWRDTGVRVQGPVVNAIQGVFAENWVEQSAEVLVGDKYFPRLPAVGAVRAHITASSPQGGVSRLEVLLKLAIASAQKELLIQNPYFIPDGEVVELMEGAVKRGVTIRVMLPGTVTDSSIVQHAGHRQFEELLQQGIHLYEHRKTLVHQKIVIVDGVWSLVGSSNFDDRSLDINDEASLGVVDPGVAEQLRAAFQRDLRDCTEVTLEAWRRRSAWHRFVDRFSYLVNEQI